MDNFLPLALLQDYVNGTFFSPFLVNLCKQFHRFQSQENKWDAENKNAFNNKKSLLYIVIMLIQKLAAYTGSENHICSHKTSLRMVLATTREIKRPDRSAGRLSNCCCDSGGSCEIMINIISKNSKEAPTSVLI